MQNPHLLTDLSGDENGNKTGIPTAFPSTSGETSETATISRPKSKRSRRQGQQQRPMLMRRWLQKLADDGDIPGLEWIDKDRRTLLRIPWCHGSRSEWNEDHSALFRAWAEHKGKRSSVSRPKDWKRNFRCALNSLKDVQQVHEMSKKEGPGAFVVYRFLPEIPKKRDQRSSSESTEQCDAASSSSSNSSEDKAAPEEEDTEVNRLDAGACADVSPVSFYQATTATVPSSSQQNAEVWTHHEQAPAKYCLDLRGTSFQLSHQSIMRPVETRTLPPADQFSNRIDFSTSCAIAGSGNLEHYRVLPELERQSFPVTVAASENLWHAIADQTLPYTSLGNSMITGVSTAATAAAAAEGIITHLEGPLMIDEENN